MKDASWVRTPIDAFILDRLERDGLGPAPEADRATYIRRVTFDLIGLPPTPEEVDAFVADPSPDAYERLVDRLLARPRYGERWGRHWLDVVRFAESHGYETNNLRPDAWPYRDYVIRAFNRDTPFARFVEEQLAGDALPDADWLVEVGHRVPRRAARTTSSATRRPRRSLQQRVDDLDDMIAATSTAFLGLTVQCARCHDHKFDPITQRDYYGLQAVFAGRQPRRAATIPRDDPAARREADAGPARTGPDRARAGRPRAARPARRAGPARPPVDPLRNVERFEPVEARFVRFTVQSTNDGSEPCLDELEVWSSEPEPAERRPGRGRRQAVRLVDAIQGYDIHRVEHLNDGRVGNGRSWISGEPGKGWAAGRAEAEPTTIDRVVWGRDREGAYRDRTPADYSRGRRRARPLAGRRLVGRPGGRSRPDDRPADSAERDRLIRRRDDLRKRLGSLGSTIKVYAGTFSQPGPTHVLRRGDPTQKLDAVGPSGVKAVRPVAGRCRPTPPRPTAGWPWPAGSPTRPTRLPARVMVNRAWHYHFGRGIVATPSDFGFNGDRPSHPELLDWLARRIPRQRRPAQADPPADRPLERPIASRAGSTSGRRPSTATTGGSGGSRPGGSRPRRSATRSWPSPARSTSAMGGPGYDLWEPNTNYVVVFNPKVDLGPDTFRRMVYQFKPRSQPDPTFGAFDCPDGGLVAPRRNASTTALQALNLLNSRFILDQSSRFADRLAREAGPDPEAQADRAFRLAFGRAPTDAERRPPPTLIREHGAAALWPGPLQRQRVPLRPLRTADVTPDPERG